MRVVVAVVVAAVVAAPLLSLFYIHFLVTAVTGVIIYN